MIMLPWSRGGDKEAGRKRKRAGEKEGLVIYLLLIKDECQ